MARSSTSVVWRAVAGIGYAAWLALVPIASHAGAARPCDSPAVFQGAAVNSFVLPYRYVGKKRTPELESASRHISGLVHLELLFSMLKYGAVGGTDLLAQPGRECNVDSVIARVSRGSGPGTLLPGQTLVVVWGRLFDQGEQLYLQTYVRFLRQGKQGPVPETIVVRLAGEGFKVPLGATLPTQSLAFPPRRISKADLAAAKAEFRKAMTVHLSPTLDDKGRSIDFRPEQPFPYYVTKTVKNAGGSWMWIEPMAGGPAGWVRANAPENPAEWSLQRWMPELAFIDGLHGFMRLRARLGGDMSPSAGLRLREWIDAGFAHFEAAVRAEDAPTAYGLARAVQGFTMWQLRQDPEGRAAATSLFDEARRFMPEYAAAHNLTAVTRLTGTDLQLRSIPISDLEHEFLGAMALDPQNAFVLGNLERLYRAALKERPVLGVIESSRELNRRLAIVRAARVGAVEMK